MGCKSDIAGDLLDLLLRIGKHGVTVKSRSRLGMNRCRVALGLI
jgi:hypothetical protein